MGFRASVITVPNILMVSLDPNKESFYINTASSTCKTSAWFGLVPGSSIMYSWAMQNDSTSSRSKNAPITARLFDAGEVTDETWVSANLVHQSGEPPPYGGCRFFQQRLLGSTSL